MLPLKKNLPSRRIARAFRTLKKSEQWQAMSFKEKHEAIFNHKLELKAQLNKEYYAKHFEFSLKELEDSFITEAEINALLEEEKIISKNVEEKFASFTEGKLSKKRTSASQNRNMDRLFSKSLSQ